MSAISMIEGAKSFSSVFTGRHRMEALLICAGLWLTGLAMVRADQVQMTNGDHYLGKVISVSTNIVTFQSDVLGIVNLPRERVASIGFGVNMPTNTPRATNAPAALPRTSSVTVSNTSGDLSAAFRQLKGDTNAIK